MNCSICTIKGIRTCYHIAISKDDLYTEYMYDGDDTDADAEFLSKYANCMPSI